MIVDFRLAAVGLACLIALCGGARRGRWHFRLCAVDAPG